MSVALPGFRSEIAGFFSFRQGVIMAYYRLSAKFFVDTSGVCRQRAGKYLPVGLVRTVYNRDNYTCQECGVEVRFGGLYDHPFSKLKPCGSIDHILPVSRGGQHEESNLRVMCKSCNCSRKADI